jgi:hypothetical protein
MTLLIPENRNQFTTGFPGTYSVVKARSACLHQRESLTLLIQCCFCLISPLSFTCNGDECQAPTVVSIPVLSCPTVDYHLYLHYHPNIIGGKI